MFSLSCCELAFCVGVVPMFLFCVSAFCSRTCFEKFSSCQVSILLGSFCLSYGSRRRRLHSCVFFERYRSGSNRTPHPLHVFVFFPFFLFFVPPRLCLCPFWPCVLSFLRFLSGCRSGPRAFSDSLGTSWGLSSHAPSEASFSDARRQGCFFCFFFVVFVFPLLCMAFAAPHVSLEGPDRDLAASGTGDLARLWEE